MTAHAHGHVSSTVQEPPCQRHFMPTSSDFVSLSRLYWTRGSPVAQTVKNQPANAGGVGDTGLIPGTGRFPGGGNGNPLQYSCLENPMCRGVWGVTVQGVEESQTWLKWLSMHAYEHLIIIMGINSYNSAYMSEMILRVLYLWVRLILTSYWSKQYTFFPFYGWGNWG